MRLYLAITLCRRSVTTLITRLPRTSPRRSTLHRLLVRFHPDPALLGTVAHEKEGGYRAPSHPKGRRRYSDPVIAPQIRVRMSGPCCDHKKARLQSTSGLESPSSARSTARQKPASRRRLCATWSRSGYTNPVVIPSIVSCSRTLSFAAAGITIL